MKTMEKLIAFYEDKKNTGKGGIKTLGNHSAKVHSDGSAEFIYHWTPIAIVDTKKNVRITYGEWNTPSTNRACSSYSYKFHSRGYTVTDERPPKKKR